MSGVDCCVGGYLANRHGQPTNRRKGVWRTQDW